MVRLLLVSLLLLCGCNKGSKVYPEPNQDPLPSRIKTVSGGYLPYTAFAVVRDSETGAEYLVVTSYYGVAVSRIGTR